MGIGLRAGMANPNPQALFVQAFEIRLEEICISAATRMNIGTFGL